MSKILAIIDGDKFSYRNKIGEFNYIGIKDLVNNVKYNIISEISARKGLNTLNEIKNADIIKYKKRTPGQKWLLNLFNDLLDTVLTNKKLKSESQEGKKGNENYKTLISSKNENEKQNKLLNNDKNANAKKKKKTLSIPKKMRIKILWEMLMINCLKNTVTVKILTVLWTNLIVQQMKKIKKKYVYLCKKWI